MTTEEALKRATIWIDILIGVADIDMDETRVNIRVRNAEGVVTQEVAEMHLGDDVRTFNALGAAGWPEMREPEED